MRADHHILSCARLALVLGATMLAGCPSPRHIGLLPDGGMDGGPDLPGNADGADRGAPGDAPVDRAGSDMGAGNPDVAPDGPRTDAGAADAPADVHQITVVLAGGGLGTVTSTPAGINCGTTCTATFPQYTIVTLQARTTNGSGAFFSGWSGAGCSGPFHDCMVTVNGAASVQATFTPMTNNLVFVTASSFPTNRGSASAYDADCNNAATAAGINDSSQRFYVAYLSDSTSNAAARLGTSRGWVRMDGRPFADTLMGLFTNNQVMNPILFNEIGEPVNTNTTSDYAMTGSDGSGMFSGAVDSCGNWTGAVGGSAIVADPLAGPFWWNPNGFIRQACDRSGRLVCMGKMRSVPLPTPTVSGKRVWLSASWPGFPVPDQHCQSAMPAGVSGAKALIARSNAPASSVVEAGTSYFRPDGMLVGTGAQLGNGGPVETGIWQFANGTYFTGGPIDSAVLTGSNGGTAADNCNDWQPGTGTTAYAGRSAYYVSWWGGVRSPCPLDPTSGGNSYFYCVQVAP